MLSFFYFIVVFNKTNLTYVYSIFILLSAVLCIYSYISYKYCNKINFCSNATFISYSIISTWIYIFLNMFLPLNDIFLDCLYLGYPLLFLTLLFAAISFNVDNINKKRSIS